ncbi:hypothetical protein [Verrucomicrobium spinosum]|uniref:hypothetical protein n=1 Tax=Verrucomicrobium spinosum TaxID=2736 RepID=UPI0004922AD4|nr:hypothetical protein [Verrucomicrobium spinosum]
MPLARLDCPHCESPVEVNVTTVTRSRECPSCGRMIMLQFTTKTSRVKHKALLTNLMEMGEGGSVAVMAKASSRPVVAAQPASSIAVAAPVKAVVPPPARPVAVPAMAVAVTPAPKPATAQVLVPAADLPPVMPRPLEGDLRNRLEHDPEVKSSARSLIWGLGIVLFLLAIAVLGKTQNWWDEVARGWEVFHATYMKEQLIPSAPASSGSGAERKDGSDSGAPVKASSWNREQEEAMTTLKSFLAAKDLDERKKFMRDASVLEKSLKDYYSRQSDGPVPFSRVELVEAEPQGPHTYLFAVVDAEGNRRNAMTLRPEPGAPYVVDWGSFVLYSEMDWAKFMAEKPTRPVYFRLQVVPAEHYNYNFPDSQRMLCLKLVNPAQKGAPELYGYCVRTSTVGRTLEYLTKKNFGEATAMIVKLRYPSPEESDSVNQVWIDEVVTEGWIARGY